jgi:hypothetical protein
VTRALAQFARVSQQLCIVSQNTTLGQIVVLTPSDLGNIWNWNEPLLELAEKPLPDADIQEQVRIRPGAIAVHSWDAELTYTELDRYSSLLAKQLLAANLNVYNIVPLLFKPSVWVVVAMLAVLKSDTAFTPSIHLSLDNAETKSCLSCSLPLGWFPQDMQRRCLDLDGAQLKCLGRQLAACPGALLAKLRLALSHGSYSPRAVRASPRALCYNIRQSKPVIVHWAPHLVSAPAQECCNVPLLPLTLAYWKLWQR